MHILVSVLPAACVIVAGAVSVTHAQDSPDIPLRSQTGDPSVSEALSLVGQCYARPINRVYVPKLGGQFQVAVSRGKVAYVHFPEWVKLENAIFEHRGFRVDQLGNELTVTPGKGLTNGDVSNMVIKLGELRLSMEMRVTDMPLPASIVDVIPLPNDDFERRKSEEEARIVQTERERNVSIMRQYRVSMARTLLGMEEVRPASPRLVGFGLPSETRYAPPNEARAVLMRILEVGGYRYLEIAMENRTDSNIRLESAYISEGTDEAVPVDVMLELPRKSMRELPAVAPVDSKIRGMVVVPENITAGLGGLRVHFRGPPGLPDVVATEVIELWPRMPEHIQRRRRWAKQIAVSARGLGGGYWMGTGNDTNVTRTEGTTMAGLGVRLTKGLSSLFAFEGELVGARSGEVTFSDVTWSNMTGDVTRQASFGRLQGAGVIRFGEYYQTSMRLGVGLQVTNYNSTMTTGGTSIDGPGDGFEVDGFFAAGLGFDARLGEHWLLGAGATFAAGFKTEIRSLEVGIHAGYRWSLEGEDGSLIER